jgi:hypothetical protein
MGPSQGTWLFALLAVWCAGLFRAESPSETNSTWLAWQP